MPRLRRSAFVAVSLIVLTTLFVAACRSGPVLNGTIYDAYSGKPVPGASIQLGTSQVTTDPNGLFTLSRWSAKDTLAISANGYEPTAVPITSEIVPSAPDATVALFKATIRPNALSGTVTDAYSGQPVEGARVQASDAISATTDAQGHYRLSNVPEAFAVTASAPNYAIANAELRRQTSYDLALRPSVLRGTITDQRTGAPISGATITAGDATATSGADGTYQLDNVPEQATVTFDADGYAALDLPLERTTAADAALRPDVISAQLLDGGTGEPVRFATIVATPEADNEAVTSTRIDNRTDGSFTLDGVPERGTLAVLAPGYKKATLPISDGQVPDSITLEPFVAKGVYVTVAVAAAPDWLDEFFDLIDRTELNTIIVDLKSDQRDDLGVIYYDSQVPIVKELGTAQDKIDMRRLLDEAKRRGIYTIARIQLFSHDNALADARPAWAVKDRETGEVYADRPDEGIRYAYLDPWNRNVWEYNTQLGVEAARLGFDEVNYDYIRYSDWYGKLSGYAKKLEFSQPTDPLNDPEPMYENIVAFMEQAHEQINRAGAFMSIDVFGRVVLGPSMPIAQDIARMAPHTDYICPMPYPSLWWVGMWGFDNPTAHPYEVILGSLQSAEPFFEGKRAQVRPWLQDHTDPWQGSQVVQYGPREVRAQIDAVADFSPRTGWLLYDSANQYKGATGGAVRPQ